MISLILLGFVSDNAENCEGSLMTKSARSVTLCLPSILKVVVFPHGEVFSLIVLDMILLEPASRSFGVGEFSANDDKNAVATMLATRLRLYEIRLIIIVPIFI